MILFEYYLDSKSYLFLILITQTNDKSIIIWNTHTIIN